MSAFRPFWLFAATGILGWVAATRHHEFVNWTLLIAAGLLLCGGALLGTSKLRLMRLQSRHNNLLHDRFKDLRRLSMVELQHVSGSAALLSGQIGVLGSLGGHSFLGHPAGAAIMATAMASVHLVLCPLMRPVDSLRFGVTAFVPLKRAWAHNEHPQITSVDMLRFAIRAAAIGGPSSLHAREYLAVVEEPSAWWPPLSNLPGHRLIPRLWHRILVLIAFRWSILAAASLAVGLSVLGDFPLWSPLPGPRQAIDALIFRDLGDARTTTLKGHRKEEPEDPSSAGGRTLGTKEESRSASGNDKASNGENRQSKSGSASNAPLDKPDRNTPSQGQSAQVQSNSGQTSHSQNETGHHGSSDSEKNHSGTTTPARPAESNATDTASGQRGIGKTQPSGPQDSSSASGRTLGTKEESRSASGNDKASNGENRQSKSGSASNAPLDKPDRNTPSQGQSAQVQSNSGQISHSQNETGHHGSSHSEKNHSGTTIPAQPAESNATDTASDQQDIGKTQPSGPQDSSSASRHANQSSEELARSQLAISETEDDQGTSPNTNPGQSIERKRFSLGDARPIDLQLSNKIRPVGNESDLSHKTIVGFAAPGSLPKTIVAKPITGAVPQANSNDPPSSPPRQKLPHWVSRLFTPKTEGLN